MRRLTLGFFSVLFLSSGAFAHQYYRHVPFNLSMVSDDSVTVNYDLIHTPNIFCSTNAPSSIITVSYKGNTQALTLPITLESDHVPDHKHEAVIDNSGQFAIVLQNVAKNKVYQLQCVVKDN